MNARFVVTRFTGTAVPEPATMAVMGLGLQPLASPPQELISFETHNFEL